MAKKSTNPVPDAEEMATKPNPDEGTGNGNTLAPDAEENHEPKFSKTQILASKWFTHRRDILSALLDDEQGYTHAEVDKILSNFLKGKVR